MGELVGLALTDCAPVEMRDVVGALRRGQGTQQVDTALGEAGTACRVELAAGPCHDATPDSGQRFSQ
jgi:hypothetical protein